MSATILQEHYVPSRYEAKGTGIKKWHDPWLRTLDLCVVKISKPVRVYHNNLTLNILHITFYPVELVPVPEIKASNLGNEIATTASSCAARVLPVARLRMLIASNVVQWQHDQYSSGLASWQGSRAFDSQRCYFLATQSGHPSIKFRTNVEKITKNFISPESSTRFCQQVALVDIFTPFEGVNSRDRSRKLIGYI